MKIVPQDGEKWRRKTDHKKILTVNWTNSCGYVSFKAPWMNEKNWTICCLETFLKRYERAQL